MAGRTVEVDADGDGFEDVERLDCASLREELPLDGVEVSEGLVGDEQPHAGFVFASGDEDAFLGALQAAGEGLAAAVVVDLVDGHPSGERERGGDAGAVAVWGVVEPDRLIAPLPTVGDLGGELGNATLGQGVDDQVLGDLRLAHVHVDHSRHLRAHPRGGR